MSQTAGKQAVLCNAISTAMPGSPLSNKEPIHNTTWIHQVVLLSSHDCLTKHEILQTEESCFISTDLYAFLFNVLLQKPMQLQCRTVGTSSMPLSSKNKSGLVKVPVYFNVY